VTSVCLPWFYPMKRYARPSLPCSGSLGLHFPALPAFELWPHGPCSDIMSSSLRYYVRLRLPAARLESLLLSLSLLNTPSPNSPVRVLLRLIRRWSWLPANAWRPFGLGAPRFPIFDGGDCKLSRSSRAVLECMPRSRTPVVSFVHGRIAQGLLPSSTWTLSAFTSSTEAIL
jgi:hypothetical protein